jgi:hypothetical protein
MSNLGASGACAAGAPSLYKGRGRMHQRSKMPCTKPRTKQSYSKHRVLPIAGAKRIDVHQASHQKMRTKLCTKLSANEPRSENFFC